jgi:hypothetical protein
VLIDHFGRLTSSFYSCPQNPTERKPHEHPKTVFLGSKTSPKMMAWNSLPEAERRAKEGEGMAAWKAWVEKHHGAIVAMGGPLGKTKKITQRGIEDISKRDGSLHGRPSGIKRGRRKAFRKPPALHNLPRRIRGGNAGSAHTWFLIAAAHEPSLAANASADMRAKCSAVRPVADNQKAGR